MIPKDEYSRALDMYNNGHYKKALKRFEALLAESDDSEGMDMQTLELYACEAHVALSKEHATEGNIAEAARDMEKAVALKPRFADLRYTLGTFYIKLGNLNKAKELFRNALEINPKYFKARVHLARVLLSLEEKDESTGELEAARAYCPNFYKKELDDLIRALRISTDDDDINLCFYEILEERPSSSQISREIAIEAIHNGSYTEAIRELKKAIAYQPDYPDLHNYLGIAYGNNGMVDDALEEFEVALKINPKYIKARLNLALVLYENGRFPEAKTNIEAVLEVQPENQLANNLLSELETVKGRS